MRHAGIWRAIAAVAVVFATLAGPAAAQAPKPAKVDVTGAWAFEVQTQAGAGTPTVTFKQEGEQLNGHYSSAMLGEADLTGTVKGQDIAFSVAASVQGTAIELRFTGTVEDANTMKGKVEFTGLGDGTFSAKRK